MDLTEKYARLLCEQRGLDPDTPIIDGNTDGSVTDRGFMWNAYVPVAEQLLSLHGEDGKPRKG